VVGFFFGDFVSDEDFSYFLFDLRKNHKFEIFLIDLTFSSCFAMEPNFWTNHTLHPK